MEKKSNHNTTEMVPTTPRVKDGSRIVKMSLFIFLFLILFIAISLTWNVAKEKETESTHPKTENFYLKNEMRKTVNFGPEYGPVVYLPSGFNFYFEGATEAYCAKNRINTEVCGEKEEDASNDLGSSSANKSLRFKSQNGKKGNLIIVLTKK